MRKTMLVGSTRIHRRAISVVTLVILLLATIALAINTVQAQTKRTLLRGATFEFQLEGNPSTGYAWQLNEAASSGLELVEVVSLGYRSKPAGQRLKVGEPAPFIFQITCIGVGFANLHFDYVSPTGTKSDTHETWVRCEEEKRRGLQPM